MADSSPLCTLLRAVSFWYWPLQSPPLIDRKQNKENWRNIRTLTETKLKSTAVITQFDE
jgi:hypothetical protein